MRRTKSNYVRSPSSTSEQPFVAVQFAFPQSDFRTRHFSGAFIRGALPLLALRSEVAFHDFFLIGAKLSFGLKLSEQLGQRADFFFSTGESLISLRASSK